MHRTVTLMPSFVCAVAVLCSSGLAQHVYRPVVGQPHVDFTLPRIDSGKPVSLSDYHGRKVLLIQFASW